MKVTSDANFTLHRLRQANDRDDDRRRRLSKDSPKTPLRALSREELLEIGRNCTNPNHRHIDSCEHSHVAPAFEHLKYGGIYHTDEGCKS